MVYVDSVADDVEKTKQINYAPESNDLQKSTLICKRHFKK